MRGVHVSVDIDTTPEEVWAQLADVRRHVDWMADAEAIRLIDEEPGLGQRFECDTKVGPLRLTDRMEITAWQPPATMGVRHTGVVTGEGRFTLTPIDLGRRTRFSWAETLRFPWWLGGRIGAAAAAPVLRRIWRHNLRSLKAQIER
jgi:uncharacterized protein YndB with AHSA1/START domain